MNCYNPFVVWRVNGREKTLLPEYLMGIFYSTGRKPGPKVLDFSADIVRDGDFSHHNGGMQLHATFVGDSRVGATQYPSKENPLRQFVAGKGMYAGKISKGRITIFHHGGGANRCQQTIDLKRNTSSLGIVDRLEYKT
ncbi:Nucleic acid-binding, OB-fold [Artemisia annua]|uniref:Nucleic acid-binding, OB-fold n=1 Tax=Artemisia annua TaxID=35608 RepID=A0A2U1L9W4_ARTAN|nr:Nucleic acid-binding, OB-fold [Artemisia annua]